MKSWNYKTSEFIETPEKLIEFMQELEALYKKYDLSISHQDSQGAFIIEKYSDFNMDWMKEATVNFL